MVNRFLNFLEMEMTAMFFNFCRSWNVEDIFYDCHLAVAIVPKRKQFWLTQNYL